MDQKPDETIHNRIIGCMVGGAVGDALGYAVEFEKWPQIVARYGERGITRYDLDNRGVAKISDDTQMAMFTAAGLLLGMTRGRMRGVMGRLDGYCQFTYLDWLHTQEWNSKKQDARVDSWLMDVSELYSRRAPGGTCLSALKAIENGRQVDNTSCGCGGVMRTAPVALISYRHGYSQFDRTKDNTLFVDDVAASAARITHKHPLGFIPSAVLNHILMSIQSRNAHNREDLVAIVQDAIDILPQTLCQDDDDKPYGELWPKHVAIMRKMIRQALDLSSSDIPDQKAIASIGEGWTGHEALAIAVYSAVKHADNFEDAIISSVNHSGDSDSTGAICGNVVGCLLGRSAIPAHYANNLELLPVIEEMAEDLYTGCIISEYEPMETPEKRAWYSKYVLHHRQIAETKHFPIVREKEIDPGRVRSWYLEELNRFDAPYELRIQLRDVEPYDIPYLLNRRFSAPFLGRSRCEDVINLSSKEELLTIQTELLDRVSRRICDWPGWEAETVKEYKLNRQQYDNLRAAYIPYWDERYDIYYSQGWFFIFRSGNILKKFKYVEKADGIWTMCEMYTTDRLKGFDFDIWDEIYAHLVAEERGSSRR